MFLDHRGFHSGDGFCRVESYRVCRTAMPIGIDRFQIDWISWLLSETRAWREPLWGKFRVVLLGSTGNRSYYCVVYSSWSEYRCVRN